MNWWITSKLRFWAFWLSFPNVQEGQPYIAKVLLIDSAAWYEGLSHWIHSWPIHNSIFDIWNLNADSPCISWCEPCQDLAHVHCCEIVKLINSTATLGAAWALESIAKLIVSPSIWQGCNWLYCCRQIQWYHNLDGSFHSIAIWWPAEHDSTVV